MLAGISTIVKAQPSRTFNGNTYTQVEIETAANSIPASQIEDIIRNKLGGLSIEILNVSAHDILPFPVEVNTTVTKGTRNGKILYTTTKGEEVKLYETLSSGATLMIYSGVKSS